MQRSRHFTLRHAIHPLATNSPALPIGSRRDNGDNRNPSGGDHHAFPCKEGLCLCRDILLLFAITLAVGWVVGGMVAKLFVELVTR